METLLPGLYVHIPFCVKKCNYCDFYSLGISECVNAFGEGVYRDYVDALKREIAELRQFRGNGACGFGGTVVPEKIDSVYIGGGTPSILPSDLICELLDELRDAFVITSDAEITIECNPGTLSEKKFANYKKAGINRLSIGVQSLNDRLLGFLGRIHDSAKAAETIKFARSYFDNVNLDFISGVPGFRGKSLPQDLSDIERVIDAVIENSIPHVSYYSLITEEGTPLYEWREKGLLNDVDEGIEREMYYLIKRRLEDAGFRQYEISNFALPRYESRHNLKYWSGAEYLGIGAGAVSFLRQAGGNNYVRYSNRKSVADYVDALDLNDIKTIEEVLDEADRKKEYMMLGFRKLTGPDPKLYSRLFNGADMIKDFAGELEELRSEGLIDIDLSLTEKGLDFANEIFTAFI